jgi:hypothetical protein
MHKHAWVQCELLKNTILHNFIIKLFYSILIKLKLLKIPNIVHYFNVHLLDKKYTKEKIIQTNGLQCNTDICQQLLDIDNYKDFRTYIQQHNINVMQITGIIYTISSSEIIYKIAIRNDSALSHELTTIYSDLFGEKVKDFDEIEKISEKSEGNWLIPLLFIYGKEKRTNIVNAGLNYDKVYVREALGYSRPMTKKDFNIHTIKKNDCFKSMFDSKKIVLGDSYFKVVQNGVFENVMKKNNKELISGFSGSCVMLYNLIFNILKLLPRTKQNELLLLFMIILDFYPIHHSISEILITYSRDSKHLKKYYLHENEIKYLKNYLSFIQCKTIKNKFKCKNKSVKTR